MSAADIEVFDLVDPLVRPCRGCGSPVGRACTAGCTNPADLVDQVDDAKLTQSAAGRLAIVMAQDLRAAGVPGSPTATTTGGNCVAVALSHPSGRDWIVASVEVWDGEPVFYIGQYPDEDDSEAAIALEIHERFSAQRAIVDMAARAEVAR